MARDSFRQGLRTFGRGSRPRDCLTDGSSLFFQRTRDLYQKIVSAYLEEGTVDIVKEHFESTLLPTLRNNNSVTTVLHELASIIAADINIPDKYRERFRIAYDEDDPCAFLAETFVFAVTRNVILKGNETPYLNPIVQEVLRLAKKKLVSSMLRPLIDQLYQYATEGLSVFDPVEFYLEDAAFSLCSDVSAENV